MDTGCKVHPVRTLAQIRPRVLFLHPTSQFIPIRSLLPSARERSLGSKYVRSRLPHEARPAEAEAHPVIPFPLVSQSHVPTSKRPPPPPNPPSYVAGPRLQRQPLGPPHAPSGSRPELVSPSLVSLKFCASFRPSAPSETRSV